ncbi:MAG: molybdate ABC transporter permease subunit [Coriobacteriales bacterium]|jgi:molybdate transport system permease protein|nr:molybdate ABC transporter permease subunit [Coriobacteriales bacterium]
MLKSPRYRLSVLTALMLCMGAVFFSVPAQVVAAAPDASASTQALATAPRSGAATGSVLVAAATTEPAAPAIEIAPDGTTGTIEGERFAITDFTRLNKGTNKFYEDSYYGYRYPMASEDGFVVVVIDATHALVYIKAGEATLLQADAVARQKDPAFLTLLSALDSKQSNGGQTIASLALNFEYTSETEVSRGSYTYRFGVEVEPGRYYATVTEKGSEDGSAGALFCVTGRVVPADGVTIEKAPEGFAAVVAFFNSMDYRPFWVSLRTSFVALVFVFVLGLLAARASLKINRRLQGILDSLFTIPMVLPPTVCGFILLVLFGNTTPFGRWLINHGIELVFSWPAAVIAATVVSFPLMYRTARGAFEGLDPALSDAARTLGWGEGRIFIRLTLPLAWPSIAAGTVLAFARAMGEFGATLFVAGNYPGVTQTMPVAIYFQWMGGHSDVATFWVFVVILISFVVILFINWYASRTQRYRRMSAAEQGAAPAPPLVPRVSASESEQR